MRKEKKEVVLESFQMGLFNREEIVDSGILGPCIAVFIYSRKNCELYAGHFVDPQLDRFEQMVADSVSRFGSPSKLEAYVAGGSISSHDELNINQEIISSRPYVLNALKQVGFPDSRVYVCWTLPDAGAIFRFDPGSGKNSLEIFEEASNDTIYFGDLRKGPAR
jgi:hypothetical protein